MVVAGQGQHQADLHDLGRLDTHEVQVEPAPRAQGPLAHHWHGQQQDEGYGVDRVGHAEPDADVDQAQGQHQGEADPEADQVLGRPRLPVRVGDGVEHHPADPGDQAHQEAEHPVDLADLDDQPVAFAGTGKGRGCHWSGAPLLSSSSGGVGCGTGLPFSSVSGGGAAPSATPG